MITIIIVIINFTCVAAVRQTRRLQTVNSSHKMDMNARIENQRAEQYK